MKFPGDQRPKEGVEPGRWRKGPIPSLGHETPNVEKRKRLESETEL